MNWFDFVLLGILVVAALAGMRYGLIRAAFNTVGVYAGWLLAGQLSDDLGALFSNSLSNDTLVTVISYAIIIFGVIIAANVAIKFVRPLLTAFTLGLSSMVDRLGGLALGLLVGLAIAGAVIIGAARLTYDFDTETLTRAIPGQVAGQVPQMAQQLEQVKAAQQALETALTGSQLVSIFINITDAIPGNALGFVPSDFKTALDILEANIE